MIMSISILNIGFSMGYWLAIKIHYTCECKSGHDLARHILDDLQSLNHITPCGDVTEEQIERKKNARRDTTMKNWPHNIVLTRRSTILVILVRTDFNVENLDQRATISIISSFDSIIFEKSIGGRMSYDRDILASTLIIIDCLILCTPKWNHQFRMDCDHIGWQSTQ